MSSLIEATEALEFIRSALDKHGSTPPTPNTDLSLNRKEISMMAEIFQPRDLDRMYVADKRHIASLADAIGRNASKPHYLDRITVWWGGDRWYVIDGHHRLEAYAARAVRDAIPCRAFAGSLDDAMAFSGLANSKDRLPMSKTDKLNYAWRLELLTDLSKTKIAQASSCAKRTVANMRIVKAALLSDPENCLEDLLVWGWKRCDALARGITFDASNYDHDEAITRRADIYRDRLYKALGNKPHTDPEAFALALLRSDERFPAALMQTAAWREAFHDAVIALRDEQDTEASLAAASYLDGNATHDDY
ncbi:ParB/Srx family N-terminal domain-containing protein [Mesorhizobium sp. LNHC209A00]|uniref:ParB/Srx family N-terminal domain-containing protein n=1 Tax=Mesorhizobium TaxID=68287 RepID=UPI0003D02200|nr:ParB/Srx family N-terminal domain-containing protein [Mesorhizobium sp. LNHC209A00]ESY97720.1 nuclease [Mesorhizobium sp. LNHC209A00]